MMISTARRLVLFTLLCAALSLVLSACGDDSTNGGGGASGATDGGAACGSTMDGKLPIIHHCGDASGEITVNGATTKFDSGACENTAASVVVNLGDNIGDPKPTEADYQKHPYLGVVAGKFPTAAPNATAIDKDGTYKTGVFVSAVAGGKPLALPTAELKMSDGRTHGTFSGTDTTGAKVSGSFSCK